MALIACGVSFEFYGKRDSACWCCLGRRHHRREPARPLLVGAHLGTRAAPIGTDQEYAGTFTDLLNPYSLFTGLTVVLVLAPRGQLPLAQDRRRGPRARGCASAAGSPRWRWRPCSASRSGPRSWPARVRCPARSRYAVLAAVAAAWLLAGGRTVALFAATLLAMAAVVVSIFVNLYPRVMVSTLGSSTDLTVTNTASSSYSLKVMTVAAAVLFPVVLVYQG